MEKDAQSKILVPIDFSMHSEAALVYAMKLAEMAKSQLLILHVVHDPGDAPGFYAKQHKSKTLRKMEDIAAEQLDVFLKKIAKTSQLKKQLKGAKTKLVSGLPATRILEIIELEKPEQVVMGSQGRTSLHEFLLGSKTEQVVRLCPVPITIVKHPVVKEKK